ncbi:hypothetical protein K450DRAFT_251470 [Umbelopsis ramanniana AG]|uniref:Uncharacterized protein n=1 Tax=Umbelopsis ramanniana AG TaxID=1314678 RepID=A0AAD5E4Y3_UMBRA|nr:uncharacterized protein K450DRAFT_251470 [Umbelopsis ramanniana AG]KAI8577573.1 hypothetical protein K450DRAFT_251470 [Umbelopsis ramanniana AG]
METFLTFPKAAILWLSTLTSTSSLGYRNMLRSLTNVSLVIMLWVSIARMSQVKLSSLIKCDVAEVFKDVNTFQEYGFLLNSLHNYARFQGRYLLTLIPNSVACLRIWDAIFGS